MSKLLSIITINYNNSKGLEKTIESVLSQKGIPPENLEYIIVDGGSTDGSVEVIKKYSDSVDFPHRISKWVSERDSGIYNAMNKGIKMSSGSIIGLVNSGDTLIFGALDNILEIHEKKTDSILYGAVSTYRNGVFEKVIGTCAENLSSSMIAHPASFVPKSVYERYGLYDESFRSSGDWDLFLNFYINEVPFYYLNKLIVDFDLSGISNSNQSVVYRENKRILKKYKNLINEDKKSRFIKDLWSFLKLILPGYIIILIKKIIKRHV